MKMITRTIETATVNVDFVNPTEKLAGIQTATISIENPAHEEKALMKQVAKHVADCGYIMITVGHPVFTEKVYGMSVETFMQYAKEVERPASQRKEK